MMTWNSPTASGAGYGLLIWLSAGVALGLLPRTPVFGAVGLGLALALPLRPLLRVVPGIRFMRLSRAL